MTVILLAGGVQLIALGLISEFGACARTSSDRCI